MFHVIGLYPQKNALRQSVILTGAPLAQALVTVPEVAQCFFCASRMPSPL
jgi:hypothetical protein